MNGAKVPVWQMIRDAAESGALTNATIKQWILSRYPGTNENTINTQILYCTVNAPSRVNDPSLARVKLGLHHLDILYKIDRGTYERFNPDRHGLWQILKGDNGRFMVCRAGDSQELFDDGREVSITTRGSDDSVGAFAAETHLRDYLASNLHVIEPGLQPFVDEFGNGHVEYRTPVGNIDIIAVDQHGGLLVIELKVDRGSDVVAGQILRYVNWVRRHLADGRPVRGLIVAKSISERLLYSIDGDPSVEAREYEMTVSLKPPQKSLM
jgi:endonuclease